MWPYFPDLLARAVPRYTSFPTAAEFRSSVGNAALEAELDALRPGTPVSLYIHIPYCREICWYCGCNTGAANKTSRLGAYLEALRAEIATLSRRIGEKAYVCRLAFGGGSPNAISPAEFEALVEQFRDGFHCQGAVLSIELDPRSYTPEWTETLARMGVDRASLGVQTFDATIQRAIGRVQPAQMIADVTDDLRGASVRSINFDLMYGLPRQGIAELETSLEEALKLRPERLAVFGYAHVPHPLPRQRRIDGNALPDQYSRFRQAAFAHHLLQREGYQPIGFDHFAVPGDSLARAAREGRLRRNFQGFTEDQAEVLIGLGASAISQFPSLIVQNEKSAGRYRMRALAGHFAIERGVLKTPADQVRGRIVEQLLCAGVADAEFDRFPEALDALRPFLEAKLVVRRGTELRLVPEALPYARAIAACFDPYRRIDPRRFSSAV
jgi:oxygen-independent coproporphyrinogen III oxidase